MSGTTMRAEVAGSDTLWPAIRVLLLVAATLATGLISGFFYAYACSVTFGLGLLPDDQYIEAMQATNATVRNGAFALSFFGAALFLSLALAAHTTRPREAAAFYWWLWPAGSTSEKGSC